MANYGSKIRTNYFKVTDVEKMKEYCKEAGYEFWQEDDHTDTSKERYAFGGEHDGCGFQDSEDIPKIQEFLDEDDICIVKEIGSEKLKYLTAYSIVIRKNDHYIVELDNMVEHFISIVSVDNYNLANIRMCY